MVREIHPAERGRVMRAWRWPARLLIVLALVAGVVADRLVPGQERPSPSATPSVATGTSDPLTSSWFCPTVHLNRVEGEGTDTEAVLQLTNLGEDSVPVVVTLFSATSAPTTVTVSVPGGSVEDLPVAGEQEGDVVAAMVEAPGGQLQVGRVMTGSRGVDLAPCAPAASPEWYFAAGDTSRDATEQLVLFNPFPGDAVVDVEFATEAEIGVFTAADLRSIVVPSGTAVAVDLGLHVRRRDSVAVALRTRSGRVVVDRVQSFDGSEGRSGLSVALGSVAPAPGWTFPGVILDDGTLVEVHIYNPNDEPAEVDLAAETEDLFAGGDPIELTVGPRDVLVVPVVSTSQFEDELRLGVAPEIPLGLVVQSANGVPVVVDVEIRLSPVALPPAPTTTTTEPPTTTTTTATTVPPTTVAADSTDTSAPEGDTSTTTTTEPPTTTTTTTTTTTVPPEPAEPVELPVVRTARAAGGLSVSAALPRVSKRWLVLAADLPDGVSRVLIHNPDVDAVDVVVARLDGTAVERVTLQGLGTTSVVLPPGMEAARVDAQAPVGVALMSEAVDSTGVAVSNGLALA